MNIQTRICYSRKKPRLYKVSGIWICQSYIDNDVVTEGGTTPELLVLQKKRTFFMRLSHFLILFLQVHGLPIQSLQLPR